VGEFRVGAPAEEPGKVELTFFGCVTVRCASLNPIPYMILLGFKY
jgi:hypothetical protein